MRLQHSHCRLKIRRASLPGFQSQTRQGVLKRGKVLSDHFNWAKTLVAKMYQSNLVRWLNQELHQVLPSPGLLAIDIHIRAIEQTKIKCKSIKNLAIGSRSFKIIQDVDVYGQSLLGPACLSWESIHKNRKDTKGRFGFPLKCIE